MQNENKPVFSTKYPWSITVGLALDFIFILLFSNRIVSGDMQFSESALLLVGIFFLIHLIICPYAGKVVVSENMLRINYFFIWNEDFKVELNKISAVSVRGSHKYRTYSKLYLTIGKGEVRILNLQTQNSLWNSESLESNLTRIITKISKEQ